jgi:SPFH domain / Band 7 family
MLLRSSSTQLVRLVSALLKGLPCLILLGTLLGVITLGVMQVGAWLGIRLPYLSISAFIAFICLVTLFATIGSAKVVNQGYEAIVERVGKYQRTLKPGLNFITPFLDTIVWEETTREQLLDIEPQQAITKDNIMLQVDAIVYWRISDLRIIYYLVEDYVNAFKNLFLTTLYSTIGQLSWEQIYSSRTEINQILLQQLNEITTNWGFKINRIEIKDINPIKKVPRIYPNTIDIEFSGKINWEACNYSIEKLTEKGFNIIMISSPKYIKEEDKSVISIKKILSDIDMEQVCSDFVRNYWLRKSELDNSAKLEFTNKDEASREEIRRKIEQMEAMMMLGFRQNNVNMNVLTGVKEIMESIDQSRHQNINTGGGSIDVSGAGALNLGEISGQVANTIGKLPASSEQGKSGIRELLTQLQEAIDTDTNLTPEDKADALEQVKVLAEVGQNPQHGEKEGLGRKAIKMLKGTIAHLPDTAKIVEAFSKLLPAIAKLLGLPV